jgi:diketogulonate reductase-like aldo/keto reductase
MYSDGAAEEVVGEAIRGRRDDVFLVTKVLPENASARGTVAAAERSLARLGTDRIDLYLLHWEGPHPLAATLEGFQKLRSSGKIARFGVSNFDVRLVRELTSLSGGGEAAANQVLYNPSRRGIEWKLIDECARLGIIVMAYSPLEQGRLDFRTGPLLAAARRHGVTPAQVALAWAVRRDGVMAIPKATRLEHVRQNAGAADVRLTAEDLESIDAVFPPPGREVPLELL